MSEDDGHEDKLIHRIIDEAVKNIFDAPLRCPRVPPDRRLLRVGPERRDRRHAADQGRARTDRQGPRPAEAGRGDRPRKLLPDLNDRDARDAATASAAEFILEGLHVHNKLNKAAKTGAVDLPAVIERIGESQGGPLPPSGWSVMPLFEYSKWDGSQKFLPQSADKVFDQLSEYRAPVRRTASCATWTTSRTRCPRSSS